MGVVVGAAGDRGAGSLGDEVGLMAENFIEMVAEEMPNPDGEIAQIIDIKTGEIIRRERGALISPHFEFCRRGMIVHGKPGFEEWAEVGETLKTIESGVQFWIGDWCNYGEAAYGQKYSQFLEVKEYQTLRNYAWVAKEIKMSRRRDILSFSHHLEVANLEPDEQNEWLDQAERENLSVRQLRREIKKWKRKKKEEERLADALDAPILNGQYQPNSVYVADIASLIDELQAQSVDLIFTDPPYHAEYLTLYDQLGELAHHVLIPGAYCIMYCGKMFMPYVINALSEYLEYIWTFAVFHPFSKSRINKHHLFENWRPLLVFKRSGDTKRRQWVQDVVRGIRDKRHHEWQQDEQAPRQYIEAYTYPGDLVLDPCVGSGTTPLICTELKRHFLAFDKDEAAVRKTLLRLKNGGEDAIGQPAQSTDFQES